MEEKLIKILKSLKAINPDEGFVQRSRNLILTSPQREKPRFRLNFIENLKLAAALALASALLFVVITGLPYLSNLGPARLADKHKQNQPTDFYIQLGEVKYDLNSDKELGAEIEKLLKDRHL